MDSKNSMLRQKIHCPTIAYISWLSQIYEVIFALRISLLYIYIYKNPFPFLFKEKQPTYCHELWRLHGIYNELRYDDSTADRPMQLYGYTTRVSTMYFGGGGVGALLPSVPEHFFIIIISWYYMN